MDIASDRGQTEQLSTTQDRMSRIVCKRGCHRHGLNANKGRADRALQNIVSDSGQNEHRQRQLTQRASSVHVDRTSIDSARGHNEHRQRQSTQR